jgi:7-cyano-7-deazaguanine synthase
MIRVLLSGGMDSAVCLAWAIRHRLPVGGRYDSDLDIVDAVGFHYGQRHAEKELEAARRIASTCRTRFRVRSLDIGGESSLTGSGELSGPSVVVPGRNRKMLEVAALMQPFPDALVIGACADDAEVFEDCRRSTLDQIEQDIRVPIFSPLVDLSKRGVVDLARQVHATSLIVMSWSCYAGGDMPCRECDACLARQRGMR